MNEFTYFIVGILVSIPVSVFAPFLTSRVQQRLAERNSRLAYSRRQALEKELQEAEDLRANPVKFATFLLGRILVITLLSTVSTLIPSILTAVGGFIVATKYDPASSDVGAYAIQNYLYSASSTLCAIAAVVIAPVCVSTLRKFNAVHRFGLYQQRREAELSRLPRHGSEPGLSAQF